MIVEDDLELREALADTLALAGIGFQLAGNGIEALERLKQHSVQMVISDVNMPGMDGHQLLAELRRTHPALPVALITAFGQVHRITSYNVCYTKLLRCNCCHDMPRCPTVLR